MEYILSLVMTAFIYLAHKSAQEIQGHSKFRFIDHFPMLLPNLTRFKSMLEPCLTQEMFFMHLFDSKLTGFGCPLINDR